MLSHKILNCRTSPYNLNNDEDLLHKWSCIQGLTCLIYLLTVSYWSGIVLNLEKVTRWVGDVLYNKIFRASDNDTVFEFTTAYLDAVTAVWIFSAVILTILKLTHCNVFAHLALLNYSWYFGLFIHRLNDT